jgi:hypothetical protein
VVQIGGGPVAFCCHHEVSLRIKVKADRFFYSSAAGVFLALMLAGFHPFFLRGTHFDGSRIDPSIFWVVLVHGVAITAWFVLFLAQSLLIAVKSRRVHMTLGWSAVAIGVAVAGSGTLVAIRSVQLTPGFRFFEMEYPRFLLAMFMEMAMFSAFLTAGILTRKKPRVHRAMMLLTGLTILPGATARTPMLYPVFGHAGWIGLFGPVFCLGALLLLIRWAMTRRFDAWFAGGYAVWVVAYIASTNLSLTETWSRVAARILAM